ncbi:DUF485 domain-containing protein [Streptomyces sp. NPDC096311]|uniref:DUF485 domain-containing protein n=1 Tax=Streptomyces sp. NPDC096311 TaxID=3366083 RepID=UPI00380506C4
MHRSTHAHPRRRRPGHRARPERTSRGPTRRAPCVAQCTAPAREWRCPVLSKNQVLGAPRPRQWPRPQPPMSLAAPAAKPDLRAGCPPARFTSSRKARTSTTSQDYLRFRMPSYFGWNPADSPSHPYLPDGEKELQRSSALGEAILRVECAFILVNAVPFILGVALSFTDILTVRVYGPFTLGLLWGALQCFLFVASAWWYEVRSTRSCDPIAKSINESGW